MQNQNTTFETLVSGIQHKKQNVYNNNDISHRQLFETPLKQKKKDREKERKTHLCYIYGHYTLLPCST
jgi:hypothetical protein